MFRSKDLQLLTAFAARLPQGLGNLIPVTQRGAQRQAWVHGGTKQMPHERRLSPQAAVAAVQYRQADTPMGKNARPR